MINFTFQRREYKGLVSMFQPADQHIVRVFVPISERTGKVFVFYKLKPDELFWHDHQDEGKQSMAKIIADTLLE